jgi:hypothetical protein
VAGEGTLYRLPKLVEATQQRGKPSRAVLEGLSDFSVERFGLSRRGYIGTAEMFGQWTENFSAARTVNAVAPKLRDRVVAELKTTFASHYSHVVSLQEALQIPNLLAYNRRATGEKFLIAPHKAG